MRPVANNRHLAAAAADRPKLHARASPTDDRNPPVRPISSSNLWRKSAPRSKSMFDLIISCVDFKCQANLLMCRSFPAFEFVSKQNLTVHTLPSTGRYLIGPLFFFYSSFMSVLISCPVPHLCRPHLHQPPAIQLPSIRVADLPPLLHQHHNRSIDQCLTGARFSRPPRSSSIGS